jgi:O-antigen biosynthesis protein
MNPLLHYLLHGSAEGRNTSPSTGVAQHWRGREAGDITSARSIPSVAKHEYQEQLVAEFKEFLASGDRLSLGSSHDHLISIIIAVHNKAHLTYACLRSIAAATACGTGVQLVIVDSGSTDDTGDLLTRLDGATVTRLVENAGFLRSVNRGVEDGSGDYIVLLNNDAILHDGALDYALETIRQDPMIGAVGGKVILPSGALQEAGCIIWSDGTCAGYGRGDSPADGRYMFRRDVAFCSGAFLMVRRDLFSSLGGFDERFAPAYYEEVDLCVRLWQAGYRVVYDPRVEILHYEFGSADSCEGALRLQEHDRSTFVSKHREFLGECPSRNACDLLQARAIDTNRKRVLFLEDHVPYPELGVGYPRARSLLHTLQRKGYVLTFLPLECPDDDWESLRRVVPLDVEVILGVSPGQLSSFLSSRIGYYDLIFVSRPNNMRSLLAALDELPTRAGEIRILYDAEAIFAAREALRHAVEGSPLAADETAQILEEEMRLARAALHVVAVSEGEAAVFRLAGCASVAVLGWGLRPSPTLRAHSERKDILFVGALDDDSSPNTDALTWFVHDVLPRIWEGMGEPVRLIVAGRCGAPRVRVLANPGVVLLGKLPDLDAVYGAARVFIAPHRYAGGIPIKVLEAAGRGVPCVTSVLLAKQLGWRHGVELLCADTAQGCAQAVIDLYSDESLWTSIRSGALRALERDHGEEGFRRALAASLKRVWNLPLKRPGASPATIAPGQCGGEPLR